MASPLDNLDPRKLQEFNKEGKKLEATFDSIGKRMSTVAQDTAKITGESAKNYTASNNIAKKLAGRLSGITQDQLKGLDKRKKFEQDLVDLQSESAARAATMRNLDDEIASKKGLQVSLETELAKARAEGKDQSVIEGYEKQIVKVKEEKEALYDAYEVLQDQENASKELEGKYQEILDTVQEMEAVNPFKGLSSALSGVPILKEVFSGLAGAADEFNKKLAEGGSKMEALQAGAKGVAKDMMKAATAMAIKGAVDGVARLQAQSVELRKGLNMNSKAATELQKDFIDLAEVNIGYMASDFNKALRDANNTLGTTARLSDDTLKTHANLTKYMGFSAEEAGKMMKFAMATGQDFKTMTAEAVGTVKILNTQNGTAIDYKEIMKDVANTSNSVKMSLQAQGYSLEKAAYEAKKMGLSMDKLDGIAGNLLDFEQSIANELEAELLLGQDLNLEKARQKALDGDLVGMGKELMNQGITAKKFNNMNRIEQEAIAKAMGMQRGEMADMFAEQEALANASKKFRELEGNSLEEKFANRLKEIQLIEDQAKREEELAKLRASVGDEELVKKVEARTLKEMEVEINTKAQDRTAAKLDDLTNVVENSEKAMNFLAKNTDLLTIATWALVAIQTVVAAKDMWDTFKGRKGKGLDLDFDVDTKKVTDKVDDVFDDAGDIGKKLTNSMDEAGESAGKLTQKLTDGIDGAADATSRLANSVDDIAETATQTATQTAAKTATKTADVAGDVTKAGAKGGGFLSKAWSGAKSFAGKAAGGIKSVAGGAMNLAGKAASGVKSVAGGAMNLAGKAASGVKNVASKAGGAVMKGVSAVKDMGVGAAMKSVKGIFQSPVVKFFGKALGPIMAAVEGIMGVSSVIKSAGAQKAAGEKVDMGKIGKQIVQAGVYPLANLALNLIPGVGTLISMADGLLGAFGLSPIKWLTDNLIDLLPDSIFKGLGEFAVDKFGGGETATPAPQAEGGGGAEVASDMASDFISRPGQPIQKFRADDIVIGATNPMGGGNGDNTRTIELLERLVAAVEKGGVINMDGNKVGTVLGMSSYRTQ